MAGDIHLVRFSPQAVTLLEHINRITGKFDLVFAGEAKPWKPMSENTDFDYGRQLSYAGLQALKDMFGGGHYGTVKAHSDRWQAFVKWCRSDQRPGINDTRQIDRKLLADYAAYLRDIVKRGDLAVSTAQNRLSSVNRTMAALRGDQCVQVLSPSKALAMQRCNVR